MKLTAIECLQTHLSAPLSPSILSSPLESDTPLLRKTSREATSDDINRSLYKAGLMV